MKFRGIIVKLLKIKNLNKGNRLEITVLLYMLDSSKMLQVIRNIFDRISFLIIQL